jgi:hypothetical protein
LLATPFSQIMKKIKYASWLVALLLLVANKTQAQSEYYKCGDPNARVGEPHAAYWGYSYDDLLPDLETWDLSEFVSLASIGQSTEGREMHELTITDPSVADSLKRRIYIHTRTHPGEVQSFWVTEQMINYLLEDSELGNLLRAKCIFHIVPMYNPDGVMLEYPRQNANMIDIESNWYAEYPETEVLNLKARFIELMQESNPIEIALNMHSDNDCLRFFVCHDDGGTSQEFFDLEKQFIGGVRDYFSTGIEPYYYMITWASGTPLKYPESWWWLNHQEKVMALTYEDMNCSAAGQYDKTAFAILSGISDYLKLEEDEMMDEPEVILSTLPVSANVAAYPNPFVHELNVSWDGSFTFKGAYLTDMQGREIGNIQINRLANGLTIDGRNLAAGNYILNLVSEERTDYIRIVKKD